MPHTSAVTNLHEGSHSTHALAVILRGSELAGKSRAHDEAGGVGGEGLQPQLECVVVPFLSCRTLTPQTLVGDG